MVQAIISPALAHCVHRPAEPLWYLTKDGDRSCLDLYERHYSCYRYRDGRKRTLFVGPGEKIVLRTGDADAVFVWRKFKAANAAGQQGINCSIFRNESQHRSSELIRQADAIADHVWPGERRYTYVNPKAVRSSNPGFCFVAAGWRRCGVTKGGLLIFEHQHQRPIEEPQRGDTAPPQGNSPPDTNNLDVLSSARSLREVA